MIDSYKTALFPITPTRNAMFLQDTAGNIFPNKRFQDGDSLDALALLDGGKDAESEYRWHVCQFHVYGDPRDLKHWTLLIKLEGKTRSELHEVSLTRDEAFNFRYPMRYEVNTDVSLDLHFRECTITKALCKFSGTNLNEVRRLIHDVPRGTRSSLKNCHHMVLEALHTLKNSSRVMWMDPADGGTLAALQKEEDSRPPAHWGYTVYKLHDKSGGAVEEGEAFGAEDVVDFERRLEQERALAWKARVKEMEDQSPRMIEYRRKVKAWEAARPKDMEWFNAVDGQRRQRLFPHPLLRSRLMSNRGVRV